MGKKIFICACLLYSLSFNVRSQDVVEVTLNKFVYLFFSDTVSFVDVGVGPEILFVDYELNMVKVIPAQVFSDETSLFVMAKNGQRKYFIIRYNDNPTQYQYSYETYIDNKKTAAVEKKEVKQKDVATQGIVYNSSLFGLTKENENDIAGKIDKVLTESQELFDRGINRNKVLTQCELVGYDGKYIYMRFRIENASVIDYHFSFVKFFVENKKTIKKKGVQEEETIPVASLVSSKTINQAQAESMVYVFEKFTITDSKEFRVEFWESNGDRKTELFLKSNDILNAISL